MEVGLPAALVEGRLSERKGTLNSIRGMNVSRVVKLFLRPTAWAMKRLPIDRLRMMDAIVTITII